MKGLPPLSQLISLRGKKALISGASSGIGRATACRFAEAGAGLVLVDANREGLQAAKKEMAKYKPPEVHLHKVDLSEKAQIDDLWEHMVGEEPDILVNNAAIYPFRRFVDVDEDFFRKVMDVNLESTFWMCQHMIRTRLKRGGVIINTGSIEALLPFERDLSVYNMSKVGVIGLTRALAKEYGGNGFRINVLIPGGIVTPGTKAVAREITHMKLGLVRSGIEFRARLPMNRAGQPDEVARMALVLASDLSSYVHGSLVAVDGGFLSA